MVERQTIEATCADIVREFAPLKVMLFGSHAYGQPTDDSDVDMLVIMDIPEEQARDQTVAIRQKIPRRFGMDLLVRTPKEIAYRVAHNDWFIREIMERGLVLYESPDAGMGGEGGRAGESHSPLLLSKTRFARGSTLPPGRPNVIYPESAPRDPLSDVVKPTESRPVSRIAWATVYLGFTTMAAVIAAVVTGSYLFLAAAFGACILTVVVGFAAAGRVLIAFRTRRGLQHALVGAGLGIVPILLIIPAMRDVRPFAARMISQNNMKQMALAFDNYESAHGHLPCAAIRVEAGRPLLSWRVQILPYIEEENLYREFHLDEPWDSPHNLALLPRMPRLYKSRGEQPPEAHMTFYRVFVGPGTGFERDGLKMKDDFPDGLSDTIAIIEAGEAAPWTKPDELEYHPDKPIPPLGGIFGKLSWWDKYRGRRALTLAAMFDGSVRIFRPNPDEVQLRAAITRNGGEMVEWSKLGHD